MTIEEAPVDLCDPLGGLNSDAVGWHRHPDVRANLPGRGRNKRWEYWAVASPSLVIAVTVSDLDYASLHSVYVHDVDGTDIAETDLSLLRRTELPDSCGLEPIEVRTKTLSADITPTDAGTEIQVRTPRVHADLVIERPAGHEALAVVVPWGRRLFQYTVKENTLPARGTVVIDGSTRELANAWATLDHGRGRWPYRVMWNWGSGSGVVDGRVVGVQVGGKWTDGTGVTENALCVDGRIHYVSDELDWRYDLSQPTAAWSVRTPDDDRVDLTFHPDFVRTDRTSLGILANETHQAFGTWTGTMHDDAGTPVRVDGVRGWAEEVVNRW